MHQAADVSAEASDSSKACSQVRSGRPVGEDDDDDGDDDDDDFKMMMMEMMMMIMI